jgi:hypothetical protein
MVCTKAETLLEWEAVQNAPNLSTYYGNNQKEYQRWRKRFFTAGLLTKKHKKTKAEMLAYKRSYYARWRKSNRDKVKGYTQDYWIKKLKLRCF